MQDRSRSFQAEAGHRTRIDSAPAPYSPLAAVTSEDAQSRGPTPKTPPSGFGNGVHVLLAGPCVRFPARHPPQGVLYWRTSHPLKECPPCLVCLPHAARGSVFVSRPPTVRHNRQGRPCPNALAATQSRHRPKRRVRETRCRRSVYPAINPLYSLLLISARATTSNRYGTHHPMRPFPIASGFKHPHPHQSKIAALRVNGDFSKFLQYVRLPAGRIILQVRRCPTGSDRTKPGAARPRSRTVDPVSDPAADR